MARHKRRDSSRGRRAPRSVQAALFDWPDDPYVHEREAWARGLSLAGVDEVGRGPLAGPVVAAAVVLDPVSPIHGLRDSKLLSARQRERLAREIREHAAAWALAQVGPRRIDASNILEATWQAMRRAIAGLTLAPGLVLVDGKLGIPGLACPQRPIVAGDRRSASIAAASILAKVMRDALMLRADRRYPGYGFGRHKGYPTLIHLEALARLGPTPLHRRSFRGVRELPPGAGVPRPG